MISPTGHGIRGTDLFGSGLYGASRDSGKRRHKGADFIAIPNQEIVAPTSGVVIREARPYSNPFNGIMFSGILLQANDCVIKMFYFEPLKEIIRMPVKKGQLIGHAQDIGIKYPGITPHIHLEIDSINPELFIRLP